MHVGLEGKIAIVIGGTSGIGRALALGLAESGADVIATSRSVDGVEAVSAEIRGLGRRTLSLCSDVSDRGSLKAVRDATLQKLGARS